MSGRQSKKRAMRVAPASRVGTHIAKVSGHRWMSALCQKQKKRIISSITADELLHTSPASGS